MDVSTATRKRHPARTTLAGQESRFERFLSSPALFAFPFILIFVGLGITALAYGINLGWDWRLYSGLSWNGIYGKSLINTGILIVVGVNLKMAFALALASYFANGSVFRRWLFVFFLIPWAMPAVPVFLSFRKMLDSIGGFLDTLLAAIGIDDPPIWLISYTWAETSIITTYVWKWLPFWVLILLAARLSIPPVLYEAAVVDGAGPFKTFRMITLPLMMPIYMTSVLLSSIWTLGDYNTVHFLTGGGPVESTHVVATLGIRDAFELGSVAQGMADVLVLLPVMVVLVWILVRRLRRAGE